MGISTKSKAGSFSLGNLTRVNFDTITPEEYYPDDYDYSDYNSDDVDDSPSVFSFFSNLFGGNEEETGSIVGSVSADIELPDIIKENMEKFHISNKYESIIAELIKELRVDFDNKLSFIRLLGIERPLKRWIANNPSEIAELLNEFFENNVPGLETHFTEEFLEKYGDSIAKLIGNYAMKFEELISDLQSGDIKKMVDALLKLLEIIDELNIPYDEIAKVFPNLIEFLNSIVNMDGINITEETLKALWNAMTYYNDVFDDIKAKYGDKDINFFVYIEELGKADLTKQTTSIDLADALIAMFPDVFDDISSLIGEKATRKLLAAVIEGLPDILDDFMELFTQILSFSNAALINPIALSILLGEILAFCNKYNIDLFSILGGAAVEYFSGVGATVSGNVQAAWDYTTSGQLFEDVGSAATDAWNYVASGQILDDAWNLANDVGGTIVGGVTSTWDYVVSGDLLDDVGGVASEVGSWGIWPWNW